MVGIRGEAGIGKSRLKLEASRVATDLGYRVHEGRAVDFDGMPYAAVATLVRQALGLHDDDGADAVRRRIDETTTRLGLKVVDRDHLADVLGVQHYFARLPVDRFDRAAAFGRIDKRQHACAVRGENLPVRTVGRGPLEDEAAVLNSGHETGHDRRL